MPQLELGKLVPTGGGDDIPLLKERLQIGRRPTNDIVLKYPNVSTTHCEMELRGGYWFVQDLGSSNGIKVNGMRCNSKHLLPGDELTIAKHSFTVEYEVDSGLQAPQDENPFGMSLMEKAGIEKRKKQRPKPVDPTLADAPPEDWFKQTPRKTSRSNDDDIMKWINGD